MTDNEFKAKQQAMSDSELINLTKLEVSRLAETYGKSHTMSIPPRITDTDMLLSELISRFESINRDNNKVTCGAHSDYECEFRNINNKCNNTNGCFMKIS